jgi:hypothetical protein
MKINDLSKYPQSLIDAVKEYMKSDWYQSGVFMYRGQRQRRKIRFTVGNDGYRNKPLDTGEEFHNSTNILAKQKLGVKVRNGIFAKFNNKRIHLYGHSHIILPIDVNNFRIFTNRKVSDFTSNVYMQYISKSNYNVWLSQLPKNTSIDESNGKEEYKNYLIKEYIDNIEEIELFSTGISPTYYNEIMLFGDMFIIPEEDFLEIVEGINNED